MPRDNGQLDTTIDIVTPENIAFHYRVAGPFRRLPAYLLDMLIRVAVFFLVGWGLLWLTPIFGGMAIAGLIIAWFLLDWFYGGLFETFMNGQTPGKWVMGLRVLTVDGQPINGMQAMMRNILRAVDSMPPAYFIPTFLVGLGSMALTSRFQRLGDVVCGTMVVIEERQWLTGVARLEDRRCMQLAGHLPADFQVSRTLARALAAYVERRPYFSASRRREVARHVAQPLLQQFGFPLDTSYDLLLCALYYRAFIADLGGEARQEAASPFASGQPRSGSGSGADPFSFVPQERVG